MSYFYILNVGDLISFVCFCLFIFIYLYEFMSRGYFKVVFGFVIIGGGWVLMLCGFMFFEMKDFGMGFLCYFICRYVKVLRS